MLAFLSTSIFILRNCNYTNKITINKVNIRNISCIITLIIPHTFGNLDYFHLLYIIYIFTQFLNFFLNEDILFFTNGITTIFPVGNTPSVAMQLASLSYGINFQIRALRELFLAFGDNREKAKKYSI